MIVIENVFDLII